MTSSLRSSAPYDTHLREEIDRAKFDVCTPSSFGGVKALVRTYVRTARTLLYGSGSQTFCDATHLKKLARLCDAPDNILQFSLPYCEINVTHNLHK